ncbi:MAG TPA: hypothetical protein VGG74_34320 [Kofleriaceae bacterium]|jgi:hypothetical protein
MTKLAILAVLAATLVGACVPQPYYHGGYGYHHAYYHHRGYWRRGYWNNGAWTDSYIYVNPDGALPAGVTVPQTDANGNPIAPGYIAPGYVAPGYVAPNTTGGVAVQPLTAPGVTPPITQPNTASGVAP